MAESIQYCFERCEKKYRITRRQQEQIIQGMQKHVRPDKFGRYTVCSIYYDTDDWRLVRASIEKPVYKEKLRVRSYGVPNDADKVFVELKKKYDGVVYKRRIITAPETARSLLEGKQCGESFGQIGREIDWFRSFYDVSPRVFVGYDRLAFAGLEQPLLRVTFDTDIRFRADELDLRSGDHGRSILPRDEAVMEIKLPGVCPLWLSGLLSDAGAFPTSFSKIGYCYKNGILGIGDGYKEKEEFGCA